MVVDYDDIDCDAIAAEVLNAELAQETAVVKADGRDSDWNEQAWAARDDEVDEVIELQMESEAAQDEDLESDDAAEYETAADSWTLDPEVYLATQMDDLEASFRLALADGALKLPGERVLGRVERLFGAIESLPVRVKQEIYEAATRLESDRLAAMHR
jgi:hypothetical protein